MEVNPGPFPPWKKDEEVENLQKIIDDQEDEIVDLKDLVDKQRDDIDNLREKLEDLLSKANEIRNEFQNVNCVDVKCKCKMYLDMNVVQFIHFNVHATELTSF